MLASDRIKGSFWFLAVATAIAMNHGSYVAGQVIVSASDNAEQPGNPAMQLPAATTMSYEAPAPTPDAQSLLKDARSAMGVKNYSLAASLIQQAKADPSAANLDYTPAMAEQELSLWMQQATAAASAAGTANVNGSEPSATMSETDIEAVLRTLLQARQALAHGDTATASLLNESLLDRPMNFEQVGDSPKFVDAMIQRQNELTTMAELHDPAYNEAAAGFLLSQAEALIHYSDLDNATLLINQAKTFPVSYDAENNTPQRLERLIAKARADAATAIGQASTTTASPTNNKAEAARLLSMAQLAIAKENWANADALIRQATALNVPEDQFGPNEVRPWQLELQVRNALNRTAIKTTLSDSNPNTVAQASAAQAGDSPVIQARYNPDVDDTYNASASNDSNAGSVALASATEPVKDFSPMPNRGIQLFRSGMDALRNADDAKAKEYFESAWQFEGQLDSQTRQAVQDQLTRLGVSTSAVSATSSSQDTLELEEVRVQQQKIYRRLQSEVLKQRANAERELEKDPRAALEIMSTLRNRVAQSNLDRDSQRPLLVSIDRNIGEMQDYIENNLPEIENREMNAANKKKVEDRADRRVETEKQMQQLVEDYNRLMKQQRYAEAEVVVRQAVDLDPQSEIATILKEKSTNRIRTEKMESLRAAKEAGNWNILNQIDADMVQGDYDNPLLYNDPDDFSRKSRMRLARADQRAYSSDAERLIWNQLENEKVQGEYRGTLNEAVEQLSIQTGINIVFDELALQAEGIEKDSQIDVPIVSPISLKSALQIILGSSGLVYVVEDEVIKVTSQLSQQSNLVSKVYYIGDLITPKSQSTSPFHMNFMQPNAPNQFGGSFNVSQQQLNGNNAVMGQQLGGGNGLGGLTYGGGGGGPQTGTPSFNSMGGRQLGGITINDFQPLIELIQNTIQNESWLDTGSGLGTIQPFVANLSLIVTQTQEIQDEIQDLLKKLRELNDVQIVIEVRFMILQDDFFERMGVDFDFRLEDNGPPGTAGIDNIAKSAIVGQTFEGGAIPGGLLGDQDIPFTQGSFTEAIPAFGGNPAGSAANFGFAILSDIEVFFLLQAAKGNSRSNVMQAPTVTMFNGQSASISDGQQRPFVTGVVPVVGDFAVGQQPIITLIPDGTNLSVQATVSEDRRFVRLNLSPFFSEITDVETFTFDGQSSTERSTDSVLDDLLDLVDGGNNSDDSDDELVTQNSGVTVQQPVVSFTSVNTVVSVPDGGTVLMGGIKRMSESREERGVPMLSNIPYINRLFKNVGIGQTTSNLMMMVTPRILIQEEIEEDQVGLINN